MVLRRIAVAVALVVLVAVQGWAMATQFRRGFRPFGAAPTRVPYSWDMFAVDIERCGVKFDPPIIYRGRVVSSFTQPLAPFEWGFVAGRAADYARVVEEVCDEGTARLTCFSRRGRTDQIIDCA